MIKKIYLLWNSYITHELITIGTLNKIGKKYMFKYEVDALKAQEQGCLLPFPYIEDEVYFSFLPRFFERRMLNKETRNRLNLNCDSNDVFSILTLNHGRTNSDNFYVFSEEKYQVLKELQESKKKISL